MPEEHIIIHSDRFITVPKALKRIAVQNDHNVETVTFDCPRYWDGLDMSKMRIYINYMCADKSIGMYLAQNVTIDADDTNIMHFDWTISRNATKVIGTLSFLVCIKKTDEFGYSINHWNSELNQEMYISEGLECEEPILEAYPDIISYLLTRQDIIEGKSEEYVREHVLAYFEENPFGVDDTLKQTGLAADAKVTGDNIKRLDERIDETNDIHDTFVAYTDENFQAVRDDNNALIERFEGHAARHAIDAEDPITPAMINAVNKDGDTFVGEDVYNGDGYGRWHASDKNTSLYNFDTRGSTDNGRGIEIANAAKKPALKDALQLHDIKDGSDSRYNVLHSGAPDFAASTALDGFPVGEIRQTARLELGDKWMECDGRAVSIEKYPELCLLLSDDQARFSIGVSGVSTSDRLMRVEEHDGTVVAVTTGGRVCISDDPFDSKSWSAITLPRTITSRDFIYAEDKWVIFGYETSKQDSTDWVTFYVYVSTDPHGEWLEYKVAEGEDTSFGGIYKSSFNRLIYHNGTWVIAGMEGGYQSADIVVYSTTNLSATWTRTVAYDDLNTWGCHFIATDVTCHDGQWVIIASYDGDTSSGPSGLSVFTSFDPAGEWTRVFYESYREDENALSRFGDTNTVLYISITYIDDAWTIMWLHNGKHILRVNDINSIDYANIQTFAESTTLPNTDIEMMEYNGVYFMFGRGAVGNVYMASGIYNTWTPICSNASSDIVLCGDKWITTAPNDTNGNLCIQTSGARYIPTVGPTNGIRTFIKVKP